MRKFVFTLAALAKYKASIEKKQKADLFRVMARLNALYEEEGRILKAMTENAASQKRALEKQEGLVQELERHDNFQTYLRAQLEDIKQQIAAAEAEKKRLQALLIVTMKEVKTLKRLRAEQYQAYLEEIKKEEALLIGDIIAHSSKGE
jgi:hypothetical protein